MQDWNGRRVIITGGTGALGNAVVRQLVEAGAECHVTWVHEHELKHFELTDRVKLHQADVSHEDEVVKLYEPFAKDGGGLWASIHVVGGFAMSPIEKTSADDFRAMLDMNAMTCFLCCREAVKAMRTNREKPGGRIVNVAARPALVPAGGMIAYTTSKAAVASITRCLAEEVKDERILVNAIAPSIMDTPANRKAMPDAEFDKWPKTDEVARAIVFFAGASNSLTTGEVLPVYGRG